MLEGGRDKKREGGGERVRKSLDCGRSLCLQGWAHPLHWSERERKRDKVRERKRDKVRERKRDKVRERKRDKVRERKRERRRICPELFFIFKGMMGALAPFSYLVYLYLLLFTYLRRRMRGDGYFTVPVIARHNLDTRLVGLQTS
jgi:hypothetical protein